MSKNNYFNLNTYDYHLDKHSIAQDFLVNRSDAKLLYHQVDRNLTLDTHFKRFADFFTPQDVLVFNKTRVRKSRLHGQKITGGKVEILLLKSLKKANLSSTTHAVESQWLALLKPAKYFLHLPQSILINPDLTITVLRRTEYQFEIIFQNPKKNKSLSHREVEIMLHQCGELPIPPYVKQPFKKTSRYQTIYGKNQKQASSIAASTAGLHFDNTILQQLKTKNVAFVDLELEIGLGTFAPIRCDNLKKHSMHSEYYTLSAENALKLNEAKKSQKRIIAVGTSSLRALEDNYRRHQSFQAVKKNSTSLFIHPPQKICSVDGLLTNFHLPKSTLFILICALASIDKAFALYEHAQKNHYRFFSLGDAMLIFISHPSR